MFRSTGSKRVSAWLVIAAIGVFCFFLTANIATAEEQRDMREGITGEYPEETKWGFLPRFKMNPDTGAGTGIKLKGVNVFGTPLLIDLANIYTVNQYQIYEFLVALPRIGSSKDNYWYSMAFIEFDIIPDMRMFGVGNDTSNHMFDPDDEEIGDEATVEYMNAAPRFTLGKSFDQKYFIALQAFYREVWLDDGDNDDLPQAREVYDNLPGMNSGRTPGLALALIRSTRDDQWRPKKGSRLEAFVEEVGPYFGADYDYTRYMVDARKYFLLFGKYNVLALHLKAETLEGHYDDMPWWELPYVGGRDSLRGYWEYRFRGRGSMLTNTEFRFFIYHLKKKIYKKFKLDFIIDGNAFFDAGRVYRYSADWIDESFEEWKYTGGFGFRFTTPPNLMGRMDIGFSREQEFATYFNFGTVF